MIHFTCKDMKKININFHIKIKNKRKEDDVFEVKIVGRKAVPSHSPLHPFALSPSRLGRALHPSRCLGARPGWPDGGTSPRAIFTGS